MDHTHTLAAAAVIRSLALAGALAYALAASGHAQGPIGQSCACDPALPNSTGHSAELSVFGSTLLSDENVRLSVDNVPPGELGVFFVSQTLGSIPHGCGVRCAVGNVGFYGPIFIGGGIGNPVPPGGLQVGNIPAGALGDLMPGETYYFQAYYEDGWCLEDANYSNVVCVTFEGAPIPELDVEEQPALFNQCPGGCESATGIAPGCDSMAAMDDLQCAANQTGAGQSILLHSGQENRQETDLVFAGIDSVTDVRIMRRHMTRKNHDNSMFGPAWAFNYRHSFLQAANGDLEMFNFGRMDRFAEQNATTWEGTSGRLDRMTYDGNQLSVSRMQGGTLLEFHTEVESGLLVGHLTAIVSPNGNRVSFSYESAGDLLSRKLLYITDSFGRQIDFDYMGGPYVRVIRDFTGREVHYDYSSGGQLMSVRSPIVDSTGGLNDFPTGKTTHYTYVGHGDPLLTNALESITFPNQPPSGPTRLEWTYELDSADTFFGWVKTHTVGNVGESVGGTYQYSYENVAAGTGPNDTMLRTTVSDRRDTVTEIAYNRTGQMLQETIFTQGFRDSEPPSRTRSFVYNADGDLVQSTDASGIVSDRTHVDPTTSQRNSQANETLRVETPHVASDQPTIRREVVYEPVFNKPFKVIDPRGFEGTNVPEDFTTTHYVDYMEDLPAATAFFAPQLGLTVAELAQHFATAGITNLSADVNGDGLVDQFCGNVIRIEYPDATVPGAADQQADEVFRFNDFGQIVYERDEEENATAYEYFGAADPSGLSSGIDPAGGGYLARIARDVEAAPGRNSGFDPTPVMQTVQFEYVSQNGGAFPANERGVPTGTIDARGIKDVRLVNELDQVVVEVRAADVSAASEPGLTAYAYQTITRYDANDNVVEVRIQNKDGLDGVDDFIHHRFEYDILDQLTLEVLDDTHLTIKTTHDYDASQNLETTTHASGSADQAVETWFYDERDILVRHTRGLNGDVNEDSTTTTEIDENGNIVKWIDAHPAAGDETTLVYDGYDRLRETIDRVGNRALRSYDAASNVTSVERRGPASSGGTEVRLAQTDTVFDERNRPYQVNSHIFHYAGMEIGTIDAGANSAGPELVTEHTIYDRLGRVVQTRDAEADETEIRYDGLSRVLKAIDPENNEVDRAYDSNDNLITTTERETSPLIASPEVFVSSFTYDSLDRRESAEEPNGQTTTFLYDSRDNLIKTTDELANEVERRYDRLDRLANTREYLSASGTNGSSSNFDPTQGGGDGVVTIETRWDDRHRRGTRTDDNGNATTYGYDDLDRKVSCTYGDGSNESWMYNPDSELVEHKNQNGSIETWEHDTDGRPTSVDIDNAGTATIGTTHKEWRYDGLDRVVHTVDDNGAAQDVTCDYVYDSLSRQIREVQTISGMPPLTLDKEWQGAGRKVACTYPDGRVVTRSYDGLDRLEAIRENGGALISRFDYVGPFRDLTILNGNGTFLEKRDEATQQTTTAEGGYDSNRRHVRHGWGNSRGGLVAYCVNSYNGPGGIGTNRRNAEARVHLNQTDVYSFDSKYRMTVFIRDGVASFRSLDGADKMTAFVDEGIDKLPEVDGNLLEAGVNQYSAFCGMPRDYDDNGSLLSAFVPFVGATTQQSYVYDFQNRLALTRARDDSFRYLYTSDNRRALKTARSGAVTRYVYDGWQVAEERDGTNAVLRQYVDGRGIDEHVQLRDLTQAGNPEYYYHGNSQGFVGVITDVAGDVVEQYTYSWLGRPMVLDPAGNDVTELYAATADDIFFQDGTTKIEELDSASTGWVKDGLRGSEIRFDVGGVQHSFAIVGNKSFLEVSGNYSNTYKVEENLEALGVLAGDPFTIHRALRNRPIERTTLHSDTVNDVITNVGQGTSTVAEMGSTQSFAQDELAGKHLHFVIGGTDRYYEIVGNESFAEGGGIFTNEFTLLGEDLEALVLPTSGDPFEVMEIESGPSLVGNAFMFQGRRYEPEAEIYYYRNRYYDPQTGEFLTFDPRGIWSHGQGNGYSTFGEDGWNSWDPLGLEWTMKCVRCWKKKPCEGKEKDFKYTCGLVNDDTGKVYAVTANDYDKYIQGIKDVQKGKGNQGSETANDPYGFNSALLEEGEYEVILEDSNTFGDNTPTVTNDGKGGVVTSEGTKRSAIRFHLQDNLSQGCITCTNRKGMTDASTFIDQIVKAVEENKKEGKKLELGIVDAGSCPD